ncbi:hypothetical protein CPC16_005743, partial [Podila verticillata]
MLLKPTIIALTLVFISMPTSSLPLDQDLTPRSESSEKCSSACDDLYKPVCGQSRSGAYQTFTNECFFNRYNACHPEDPFKL